MTQQHYTPIALTDCDIQMLSWIGQQQAIRLDQLQHLLAAYTFKQQESRKTIGRKAAQSLLRRWRRAGLVRIRQYKQHEPAWIWLSRSGSRSIGTNVSRKPPQVSVLHLLYAINCVRLALEQDSSKMIWICRQQLLREHAHLQTPSPCPVPTAEYIDADGTCIAIHVTGSVTGTIEQIVSRLKAQLHHLREDGQPYYRELRYYATEEAAYRLRAARICLARAVGSDLAHKVNIFSYPLVPKSTIYHGHRNAVRYVSWSSDGKWMASTGDDSTMQVWSVPEGLPLFTQSVTSAPITALALPPNSSNEFLLACADEEGVISIWDVQTAMPFFIAAEHKDMATGIVWSPDGTCFASCSLDGTIQIRDIALQEQRWKLHGHEHGVCAIAWSPDGTRLATGGNDARIRIWDAATGQLLLTYRKHPHFISTLAWSPDSTTIASASDHLDVQIWDASSGKKHRTIWSGAGLVYSLAWSPDGTRLAWTHDDPVVEVWNLRTGRKFQTYRDHADMINSLNWSPDGNWIASGSQDTTVHIWQVEGGQ